MPVVASYDASKRKSTGCAALAGFLSLVIASSSRIASPHTEPMRQKRLRKHPRRTACPSVTVPGGRSTRPALHHRDDDLVSAALQGPGGPPAVRARQRLPPGPGRGRTHRPGDAPAARPGTRPRHTPPPVPDRAPPVTTTCPATPSPAPLP